MSVAGMGAPPIQCCATLSTLRTENKSDLDMIEAHVPAQLDVPLLLDNEGTHKTALIRRWLLKRPRFHLLFTPTSTSWINLVKRWFALLTERQLRQGVPPASEPSRPPSDTTSRSPIHTPPSHRPRPPMKSWPT